MIRNYIITALRHITRRGIFSLINVGGLATGMACSILILMWVDHEMGYDRFHPDYKNIQRIGFRAEMRGSSMDVPVAMAPLARALQETFPEVDDMVRIDVPQNVNVTVGNEHYAESLILRADSSFFSFFGFELETGDPSRVLTSPFNIVITRDLARKYFGDANPVGEIIRINNTHDYTVTGIAANPPSNSHINFDAVTSFMALYEINHPSAMDHWLNLSYFTYMKVNGNYEKESFFAKLDDLLEEHIGSDSREHGITLDPFLQPVTSIHLNSNMLVELSPPGNKASVYIFLAVSVFILILACINFMNLSTAKAAQRSREVGVRKVSGALRIDLVRQFLGESLVYTLIAALIAIPLIELGLPFFNNITNLDLSFFSAGNLRVLIALPFFVLLVGLFAGSYPAFVISSHSPLKSIKSENLVSSGRSRFRSVLVVFQMVISITLLVCTIFVWKQLDYINSSDLGFEKSNKVIVGMVNRQIRERYEILRPELISLPGVKGVSFSTSHPGMEFSATIYKPGGSDEEMIISHIHIDDAYLGLMDISLIEGRNFDGAFRTDTMAVLVNETAVRAFGWSDPLDMTIVRGTGENSESFRVIGVVGDFHFRSIHQPVEPLVIHLLRGVPRFMTIDLEQLNSHMALAGIGSAWENVNPGDPFDFQMLADIYDFHYRTEMQMSRIFTFFTILALLIAALGLYGLSSYMVENKTKEIGVRKVFGAPVSTIVLGFFHQFGLWLLVANIVSWALAWYFMDKWLSVFAYKISLYDPVVFALSALLSALVVLMAAGYQSLRAANINPVVSLRYE